MRLHQQGLVYRSAFLVNWSPSLRTAISDLEAGSCPQGGCTKQMLDVGCVCVPDTLPFSDAAMKELDAALVLAWCG